MLERFARRHQLVDGHAVDRFEPLGQPFGIGMVVDEELAVVTDGVKTAGGDDAGTPGSVLFIVGQLAGEDRDEHDVVDAEHDLEGHERGERNECAGGDVAVDHHQRADPVDRCGADRADEAERATLLARRTVAELENSLALIPAREARIAAQIARSEAAIARAERSLENTTLTTPFDLRVTEVSAERFQTVAPGQVVIRADGIAAAEVVAHLAIDSFRSLLGDAPDSITLADMMHDGPAGWIEVTLSPLSDPAQVWAARVMRIEGALDARARTVPVVVMVDDPYEGADPPRRLPLVPNMQVGLTFQGAPLTGVIAIPEAALHGGQLRVVGTDDLLELRPVVMAFAQGGRVVIAEGLSPGDRVVIDDIAPAIPGMALTPVEAPE